jgi:hypothetical protein
MQAGKVSWLLHPPAVVRHILEFHSVAQFRRRMTVLNGGRFAGSGVRHVPKYPAVICADVSRNAPQVAVTSCKLIGSADTPSPLSQ